MLDISRSFSQCFSRSTRSTSPRDTPTHLHVDARSCSDGGGCFHRRCFGPGKRERCDYLCAHARDVSSSSIYVLSSILPPLYTYAQYAKEEPANKFNTRFCWVIYPTRWVTFLEGKATLSSFYFKFRYAKNCFALIDKLKKKINSTYDFHMGLARSGCFLGA